LKISDEEKQSLISQLGEFDSVDTAAVHGIFDTINNIIGRSSEIIIEILRAGAVNPFVGAMSMWISADILEKANLIYPTTNVLIKAAGLTYLGISVTTELLSAVNTLVDDIDPADFLKGVVGSSNQTVTTLNPPQNLTIVYTATPESLQALLGNRALPKVVN
jgi:hypothetical protein